MALKTPADGALFCHNYNDVRRIKPFKISAFLRLKITKIKESSNIITLLKKPISYMGKVKKWQD
jgi:hypothetical protein